MSKKDVIDLFKAARRVSTPIVAISTSDQRDVARRIFAACGNGDDPAPKFAWDVVRGCVGINDVAKEILSDNPMVSPVDMLVHAEQFPRKSVIAMYNADLFLNDPAVIQGIFNLRDAFCTNMRTLALLGPDFHLPPALRDVVLLDEPLPLDEQLNESIERTYQSAYGKKPGKIEQSWVDAVRGLSAFEATQVFAMSLNKNGVSEPDLWERKRTAVNQQQGLEFVLGGPTFDDLGGLESFKEQMRRIRKRFGVIVFADEIEKQMAGTEHDTSGVSQDFHGQMLQWMQDRAYTGMIAIGPPGSGKTAAGMSIGPDLGIPTIRFDINGLKGSLVGESERNMRQALKVIDSVAGDGGAFVFATCNSEAALSPEFKRRFWMGETFFDLPTSEERDAIWKIHLKAFGLKDVASRPDDSNWTGAEIRNCCARADMMGISLKEAAKYIVPIAKSSAKRIDALRAAAHGKWLSASYEGVYKGVPNEMPDKPYREVKLAQ